MINKKLLTTLTTCLLATSCASIFKGSEQEITIDSNVQGAELSLNGEKIGTTPFQGKIKRSSDAHLTVSKPGYESKEIILDTSIEPVFLGNIISGGVFGSSTDYGTGAMYQYSPGNVVVDLKEISGQGKL